MSDPSEEAPVPDQAPGGDEPVGDELIAPQEPEPVTGLPPQEAQPPGAELTSVTGTVPAAPNGEDATVVVKHDSGVNFFHNLGTLPHRFLDEAGNVILGRHLNVTVDEASGQAPAMPPEEPTEEPPA